MVGLLRRVRIKLAELTGDWRAMWSNQVFGSRSHFNRFTCEVLRSSNRQTPINLSWSL